MRGKRAFAWVQRVCVALITLWGIATVTFFLMKAIPGDPFQDEQGIPEDCLQQIRSYYGLQDPLYVQYARYIKAIFSGNFGPSLKYPSLSVNEIISVGFPVSALLGVEALLIALPLGVSVGMISALRHGKATDFSIRCITAIALSAPTFLLGSLLQFLLAFYFPIFPIARFESFAHTILPAITLAIAPATMIAKLFRANAIEVLHQPYIMTARMKGLSTFTIFSRHVFKNSFLPVLSYLGPVTANVLVGSFIVERIFAIPGLGQWLVYAVMNRDYPVIGGLTIFYSIVLLSIHMLIDIAQTIFDPRIRLYAEATR